MMRPIQALILCTCMLALGACTSTESVLDIADGEGPTPPAPIGTELSAAPAAFATDPQAIAEPAEAATAQAIEPAPALAAPAPVVQQPLAPPSSPAVAPAPATTTAALVPRTGMLVQVAPIVGATEKSVVPLSQRMALRAAERGVRLTNAGGTHVMRGYFSAMREGEDAVVIYVWDVIDNAGNRVHRIQGQEKVPMRGDDPWSAIDNRTMETIAEKTVDDLSSWLGAQRG